MRKMIKKTSIFLMLLFSLFCVSIGTAISVDAQQEKVFAKAGTTIADKDYYISGAGVRLINDADGAGIRFHTRLTNEEFEKLTGNYKTGTLIIPEIRYDGDLTLEDLEKESKYRPVHIDTTKLWYEATVDGFMQSTAYLYNVSEQAYGARYVARSYVTYEDGTTAYSYTQDKGTSMTDIANEITKGNGTETQKRQVAPYIVEEVSVTYQFDGTEKTETVAYASKLTVPVNYDKDLYNVVWTDQYGREWDFATDELTMPLTLTLSVTPKAASIAPILEKTVTILDGAIVDSNYVDANADLDGMAVPAGFRKVSRFDSNANWSIYVPSSDIYNATDISAYSTLWYAIKISGAGLRYGAASQANYTIEDWIYFKLEQTSTNVWSVTMEYGDTKVTYENQSGSTIQEVVYGGGLNDTDGAFLLRKMPADSATIYATEVCTERAKVLGDCVMDTPLKAGVSTTEVEVPSGYASVSKKTNFVQYDFATDSLNTELTYIRFAFFMDKDLICRGNTLAANTIHQVSMERDASGAWKIAINEKLTWTDGYKNNNLSSLLAAIKPNTGVTNVTMYATEVRTEAVEAVEPETPEEVIVSIAPNLDNTVTILDGAIVDSNYVDANADLDGMAVPAGFRKVSRFDSNANWSIYVPSSDIYNATDISAYSTLWYAIKISGAGLRYGAASQANYTIEDWIYFKLEQTSTNVWSVTMEYGDTKVTYENQSGSTIQEVVYGGGLNDTDGAFLLRKMPADSATIYATEVRAERANPTGERVVWSALDDSAVTKEVEIPNGYAAVYKKLNFVQYDFAEYELPKTVTNLHFAFFMDKDLICRGQTLSANTMHKVSMERDASGSWEITINGTLTWTDGYNNNNLSILLAAIKPNTGVTDVTMYATEVRGGHTCSLDSYSSLNDGTHQGYCACGEAVGAPIACTADATWVENEYICNVCDYVCGSVETQLDSQNVALFTDATATTFNANAANAVIDISSVTELTVDTTSVTVYLDGEEYEGAVADGKLTIPVVPTEVFGEYTATFTLTIEGRDFEITAPVLIITDMITTETGLRALRTVLRGADTTATANTSTAVGGIGGENTMNGDGYYMLGANITLSPDGVVYAFGTSIVPFVGTFDGNGHYLLRHRNSTNYAATHNFQDTTTGYQQYLEASLFGRVDGTIKNLALTTQRLGRFANFVHSGTGTIENVYVQFAEIQNHNYSDASPFFAKAEVGGAGTLRNVVFDFTTLNDSKFNEYITNYTEEPNGNTIQPMYGVTGRGYKAENVAVYAYNMKLWYNASGVAKRGGIYFGNENGTWISGDGANFGIYAEFADGTNNGAQFFVQNLDDAYWNVVTKTVNGVTFSVPTFRVVANTGTNPSDIEPEIPTANYYIAWDNTMDGAYDGAQLIREATVNSTTLNVSVDVAEPTNTEKNQILIGTFAEYYGYLTNQPVLTSKSDYGVYKVDNTIFVLAEDAEGIRFATEELCRRLYDWQRFALGENGTGIAATAGIDLSDWEDYTTAIAYETRKYNGGKLGLAESEELGFSATFGVYTQYKAMHNTLDYFEGYADANAFSNAGDQLCYLARGNKTSFDNMVSHVVDIIVAYAQEKPDMTTINFMVEDNAANCTCSECASFSNPSIPQLVFLNEVAKALRNNATLAAANRTIDVEFFAYSTYAYAPVLTSADITALNNLKNSLGIAYQTATFTYDNTVSYAVSAETQTVLKAEDGLRLWWTTHKANHSFELEHEANDHMYLALQGWLASVGADNIDVFMYQTAYRDYFLPLNTWKYQVAWYNKLNALGLDGYIYTLANGHNDMSAQTAFSAFKQYIDSRSMVDAKVTYEQLKAEFFSVNGYYGKAGPTMLAFFNELETVLENKKQTSGYYDPNDYIDSTVGTPAERLQLFFNGHYLFEVSTIFSGWSSNSGTGLQTMYVHSKYGSQKATLEAWYTYCTDALALVDEDSVYAKRIGVESWFPEYAFLMLQSTYETTAKYSSNTNKYTGTVKASKADSDIITVTYQEFYEKIVAGGAEKPSESYEFNSNSTECTHAGGMFTAYQRFIGDYYGMYYSMFVNWGVTF